MVFISLLSFVLSSCNQRVKDDKTYFGGEILNPKSSYVLLMKGEKTLDTLPISTNHTFGKALDSIETGLYFFKHGNEFQYLYLQPGDSINIRLNTWDFDESLVFDGKGADKSDYLINVFLLNEKETNNFYSYFPLSEEDFEEKFDQVLQTSKIKFQEFQKSNPKLNQNFIHLAKGATFLPLYRLKELYPYFHDKMSDKNDTLKVDDDFFGFRKDIQLNDPILSDYYGYQNYVSAFLYNEANRQNDYKGIDDNFKRILLQSIIDSIHIESLKNRLLYQEVHNCLFKDKGEIKPEYLDIFYKNCTDQVLTDRVNTILGLQETLTNMDALDNEEIKGRKNGTFKTLKSLYQGENAVIYLWSENQMSQESLKKRVKYLSSKFPDVVFIEISTDNGIVKHTKNGLGTLAQYEVVDIESFRMYASDYYPRSLVIDKKGKVVENFSLIYDYSMEKLLDNVTR